MYICQNKKTLSPLSEERALKTQTNKHKSVGAKIRLFFISASISADIFIFYDKRAFARGIVAEPP